jgi:hypothetical protein
MTEIWGNLYRQTHLASEDYKSDRDIRQSSHAKLIDHPLTEEMATATWSRAI